MFFGFLSFHYESQLVNIAQFSLPGNWAFWSVGLLFALRTASQITYQQFIHISCGLVAITSPETNFTDRIIPSIFFLFPFFDKTCLALSPLVECAFTRRDDGSTWFIPCFAVLARSTNDPSVAVDVRLLLVHLGNIATFRI